MNCFSLNKQKRSEKKTLKNFVGGNNDTNNSAL